MRSASSVTSRPARTARSEGKRFQPSRASVRRPPQTRIASFSDRGDLLRPRAERDAQRERGGQTAPGGHFFGAAAVRPAVGAAAGGSVTKPIRASPASCAADITAAMRS